MIKIFIIFIFSLNIYAINLPKIKTFSANFNQKIINNYNQNVVYTGKVLFKKPYYSKWIYKNPVDKIIYTNKNQLIILDNDLEQISISKLVNQINFIDLFKNAKKISKNHYKTIYLDINFDIYTTNSTIKKVVYKDTTDNNVILGFKNQKINKTISKKIFKYKIPKGYDILK
jgi:outer membrane lipoprotein-sorting protein